MDGTSITSKRWDMDGTCFCFKRWDMDGIPNQAVNFLKKRFRWRPERF